MEAATNTVNLQSGSETVEMNTSMSTAAGKPLGFLQRPVVINLLSFPSIFYTYCTVQIKNCSYQCVFLFTNKLLLASIYDLGYTFFK